MKSLAAGIRAVFRAIGIALAVVYVASEDLARLAISPFLAALERVAFWRRIEAMLAGLPPYGALAALAVPVVLLEPVQLLALWWIAEGSFLAGALLLAAAKLAGMAVIVRMHALALDKLLSIGWYARLYGWALAARAWLYATAMAVPGIEAAISTARAYGAAVRAWVHSAAAASRNALLSVFGRGEGG